MNFAVTMEIFIEHSIRIEISAIQCIQFTLSSLKRQEIVGGEVYQRVVELHHLPFAGFNHRWLRRLRTESIRSLEALLLKE